MSHSLIYAVSPFYSRKAIDNIDLNQMSHRYVRGVLQNDWNVLANSRHLIDRSEDVIFELVWVTKTVNIVISSSDH